MEVATAYGIDPDRFYNLTAFELRQIIKGRSRQRAEQIITTGWYSALYGRMRQLPPTAQEALARALGDETDDDEDGEEFSAVDRRMMAYADALERSQSKNGSTGATG